MTTALRLDRVPGTAHREESIPAQQRTAGSARSDQRTPAPYLTPVPDSLPPFDDERTAITRLRALAARQRSAELSALRAPVATVLLADEQTPSWSNEADIGVRRTASRLLPEATRVGHTLARALVEVMAGTRPLAQLRAHCAPEVFCALEQHRAGHEARPALLSSVRVSEPADGVAEVSAVFRTQGRARALAFRLKGLDGRWRVTELEAG